jgi:hypothetical protein
VNKQRRRAIADVRVQLVEPLRVVEDLREEEDAEVAARRIQIRLARSAPRPAAEPTAEAEGPPI